MKGLAKNIIFSSMLTAAVSQGCKTTSNIVKTSQEEIKKELNIDSMPKGMYKDSLGGLHIDLTDTLEITPDQNGVYITNYRPIKWEQYDYLKQDHIPDSIYRKVFINEGRGTQEGGLLQVPQEFLDGLESNVIKAKEEGRLPESDWQQKSRLCYCATMCTMLKVDTGEEISWEHLGYMWYLEQLEKMAKTGVIQKIKGTNRSILDGGNNSVVLDMIDNYGALPKEAFHIKVKDLDTRPIISQIDSMLLSVDGKPQEEVSAKVNECITFFKDTLGTIPDTFEHKGVTYTPKEFAKSLGLDTVKNNYINIYSRNDKPHFALTENYDQYKAGIKETEPKGVNLSPQDVQDLIIFAIDQGAYVGIGSDFYEPFVGKHQTVKYTYIPDTYLNRSGMSDDERAQERHNRVMSEYNTANHSYVGVAKFEQGGKTFIITADSGNGSHTNTGPMKGYRAMDIAFLGLHNSELMIAKDIVLKYLAEKGVDTKAVEQYKFGE